jgi:hypothetical protein
MSPKLFNRCAKALLLLLVLTSTYAFSTKMTTPTPTRNLSTLSRAVNSAAFTTGRFRTTGTVANVNTFFANGAVIDEAGQVGLAPKDRIIFHSKAVEGLVPVFSMKEDLSSITDPSKHSGSDFFEKSLDLSLMVRNLMSHINRHVMNSVFNILNVEEIIVLITGNTQSVLRDDSTINLLEHYFSLDLNTVMISSAYYVKYSLRELDAENMMWTQELILNSCDDELKHYLMSRLCLLPPEYHGGPTVFMMLVEQIISYKEHLARALINHLNQPFECLYYSNGTRRKY